MTTQKENPKNVGGTQNPANTQNPKTGNQREKTDNSDDVNVEEEETTETENDGASKSRNQTEAGSRNDTQNDPTRIRPGVNEPGKVDQTGTQKKDNRK